MSKENAGQRQVVNNLFIKDSLRNFGYNGVLCGFEFEVTGNGYRGTYLSCVEGLSFELNGKPIGEDKIVFFINNKRFLLKQLKELYAEYWYTTDSAIIRVYQDGGLAPGEYTIGYRIVTRMPYSGYFGSYRSTESKETNTFILNGSKK